MMDDTQRARELIQDYQREWDEPVSGRQWLLEKLVYLQAQSRREGMEEAAKVADEYPQRDPAEDGNGYWAAREIAGKIRERAKG